MFAVGLNNGSVHLNNDLIVVSGGDSATMLNVERATGDVITEGGSIVLGETIEVQLTIGNNDDRRADYGIYSGDISVKFDCLYEPDI